MISEKRILAITQALILILGTIAISYAIGNEFKLISADEIDEIGPDSGVSNKVVGAATPSSIPNPVEDTDSINEYLGIGGASTTAASVTAKAKAAASLGSIFNPLGGFGSTSTAAFAKAAGYAVVLYVAGKTVAKLLGASSDEANAIGKGLGLGFIGAKLSYIFFTSVLKLGALAGPLAAAIGGIIFLISIFTTKDVKYEIVSFQCLPWQPASGGSNCDKCNQQGILGCTEYQCKALGAGCELINKGSKEQLCFNKKANDVAAPIIQTLDSALTDGFRFTPDNTISPPDRGVKIENTLTSDKCVKAFQPFIFGIKTDEPAKCKIDFTRKRTFDEMKTYFGGSTYSTYNHTQSIVLPSNESLNEINLTLQNGGQFELFVKCMDEAGNKNVADFVIKYCVDKGPDTSQPIVLGTSILNGAPIGYNQSSAKVDFYINEPADCRWTHDKDKTYEDMEGTMTCAGSLLELNAQSTYPCKTELTGIKDDQENKFYIRCQDRSSNKNTMKTGYEYSLIGTKPLSIINVAPNGTVRDSTETVKVTLNVETLGGYKDGESTCYYSETDNDKDYAVGEFYTTGTNKHSQELYLPEGDYKYFFKCVDLGGNTDFNFTEFHVESDNEAPMIVRAYHEDGYLKLITNENATCSYSSDNCNYQFNDGISMSDFGEKEHYVEWDSKKTYYVKCQDDYGNQPASNSCSLIVRPVD